MRQAVKAGRRRSAGDVLLGVAALGALAALVAGVPYALYSRFGSPIPEQMPDLNALTQRIGPSSVISILVFLVWLAWLQLAACVIVEVYAAIRGIGVPTRVPLAGGTQSLVHRLVVTALLLFTATTAIVPAFAGRGPQPARPTYSQSQEYTPPAPQAVETPVRDLHTDDVADHPVDAPEVTKVYHVQPPTGRHHESLWEIAEKCLGDGRRYKEIYHLNKGLQQPDGSRLTIASLIRPGWRRTSWTLPTTASTSPTTSPTTGRAGRADRPDRAATARRHRDTRRPRRDTPHPHRGMPHRGTPQRRPGTPPRRSRTTVPRNGGPRSTSRPSSSGRHSIRPGRSSRHRSRRPRRSRSSSRPSGTKRTMAASTSAGRRRSRWRPCWRRGCSSRSAGAAASRCGTARSAR
jgi:hypothetical protein